MKRAIVAVVGVLAACGGDDNGDVRGPFTGDVHRYVVDAIVLPQSTSDTATLGDDLDGDGQADNQVGLVISTLVATHDATTHAADMIASGALASSVELQADDLAHDPAAGASYLGADGDPATQAGGTILGGTFRSNRSATTHVPGKASVRLPVYADADPVAVELDGVELELATDGNGGFDALIRGGVPIDSAKTAAYAGLLQMMLNNPKDHLVFARLVDTNHDGEVTTAELVDSSLLASLLVPDLQLFDGATYRPSATGTHRDSMSLGFQVHLVPCDAGTCATAAPADRCHDRVVDGAETDVDCGGGTCGGCAAAATCAVPADCQSNACDAGHCRAPTCSDGVRDGFESDVDCGANCTPCALGKVCAVKADCASGSCNGAIATGVCVP
jgi:hypothetical protein